MKKLSSILLVFVLVLALASCGQDPEEVSSDPGSESSSSSDVSDANSSSSSAGSTANSNEEAAKLNAAIKPEDIRLIQFEEPESDAPTATITTSVGDIIITLYPEQAPKAVENFVTHARDGYYNGLDFYKAIDDFIIQSGAPDGAEPESIFTDEDGNPVQFESEFSLDLWNFRGALTMVNEGSTRPDTNTSEFFIIQADAISSSTLGLMQEIGYPQKVLEQYEEVGGLPGFDWHNTVFGMVTEGMDVVDEIAAGAGEETVIIESIAVEGIQFDTADDAGQESEDSSEESESEE